MLIEKTVYYGITNTIVEDKLVLIALGHFINDKMRPLYSNILSWNTNSFGFKTFPSSYYDTITDFSIEIT